MDIIGMIFTPWMWGGLAALMLVAEMLVPGIAFLWLGLAAAAMGLLVLVLPIFEPSTQILLYAILALATVVYGRRIVRRLGLESPARGSKLNARVADLIGTTAILTEPTIRGQGQVKIGDSVWAFHLDEKQADLPAGAPVELTGANGTILYGRSAA
jgi:membrane protein implicated in regulation of membrane protease activity